MDDATEMTASLELRAERADLRRRVAELEAALHRQLEVSAAERRARERAEDAVRRAWQVAAR